jgi:molybdopterin molybdotransferase
MTSVAEAETLILAHMPRFPARQEALAACVGRVLAENIAAERDQPPFDRVTMDGIAVAYSAWSAGARSFEIIGTQPAGAAPLEVTGPAQCVEVMTGTVLPRGTDTVIPVERIERRGSATAVTADAQVNAQQFVHRRGSDRLAEPSAACRHAARRTRDRCARGRWPGVGARDRAATSGRDLDGR